MRGKDRHHWIINVRKHWMYGAWAAMKNRCDNPNNSSYHQYGARGITVCDRWRDFRNFIDDMEERPDGMTLDRIDPKGPYAPENCRWATASEQRTNLSEDGIVRQRDGAKAGANRRWADPSARLDASERTKKQWVKRRANPLEF